MRAPQRICSALGFASVLATTCSLLAVWGCASSDTGGEQAGSGGAAGSSGGAAGSAGSAAGAAGTLQHKPGDPCSHDTDCDPYECKSGQCFGAPVCNIDANCSAGAFKCVTDPRGGSNFCWTPCSSDSDCVASGFADYQKCTSGVCYCSGSSCTNGPGGQGWNSCKHDTVTSCATCEGQQCLSLTQTCMTDSGCSAAIYKNDACRSAP